MEKLIEELRNSYKEKYNKILEEINTLIVARHQLEGAMMAVEELAGKMKLANNGHKEKKAKVKGEVNK